jgi:hypothetical protein
MSELLIAVVEVRAIEDAFDADAPDVELSEDLPFFVLL